MASLTARAQARVGLLGNPSDLYGGRGIGFATITTCRRSCWPVWETLTGGMVSGSAG